MKQKKVPIHATSEEEVGALRKLPAFKLVEVAGGFPQEIEFPEFATGDLVVRGATKLLYFVKAANLYPHASLPQVDELICKKLVTQTIIGEDGFEELLDRLREDSEIRWENHQRDHGVVVYPNLHQKESRSIFFDEWTFCPEDFVQYLTAFRRSPATRTF